MVKGIKANISQMEVHQYLIVGRAQPTDTNPEPTVYKMRIFAKNTVLAKTKFWYGMRKQHKIKKANGEVLAIHELYEKNPGAVKTFGMIVKYQSRTLYHNMYKEYRDTSLNGAVSQMYLDMAGRHKARLNTIHVVRTCVVPSFADIKRPEPKLYAKNLKFPIVMRTFRSPIRKYKKLVTPHRPHLAFMDQIDI